MDYEHAERMARVEEVAMNLQHRLFGNGQPGEISDLDKRLNHLEKRENRLMGFVSAVVLFMEISHHSDWILKLFHG